MEAATVWAWRRAKAAHRAANQALAALAPLDSPKGQGEFAYEWLDVVMNRMLLREPRRLRPNYLFGATYAAYTARNLGYKRISLVEFGVAGGLGLVCLDRMAPLLQEAFKLEVEVHGFDTGKGLPPPSDQRDSPSMWSAGDDKMDVPRLQAMLQHSQLHLGDVKHTVPTFVASRPAPIAFISFDLDYYSSTIAALAVLDADFDRILPRVVCYFDDIIGHTFTKFNGELLAIEEFNGKNPHRQLAVIRELRHFVRKSWREQGWPTQTYLMHSLEHPLYDAPDGTVVVPQLTLSGVPLEEARDFGHGATARVQQSLSGR